MAYDYIWAYFAQGKFIDGLSAAMNDYPIPNFGVLWLVVGGAMYAVLLAKTQDFGITGVMLTFYLALVSIFINPAMWIVFAVILALHIGVMGWKIFKG